ncbi:unnamed protein product [Prorocentrum cordatum]|uniref:Uncharacterized protein n=1 Tax=Prorocentrum cordatum TaxID=2364126 RepID=A0ABN9S716_9DINO|nr:unnamed protein product [Polarella glacialis]
MASSSASGPGAACGAAPAKVSELLFRRDMLGPSLGNLAASLTGMLLIEKLSLTLLVPALTPWIEAQYLVLGRLGALVTLGAVVWIIVFWGIGTLMVVPAFFDVKRWKIQPGRTMMMRQLLQSMPLIIFNFLLAVTLPPVLLNAVLPEAAFDLRALPDMKTVARDVAVWMFFQETLFFYIHRWFHTNKAVYKEVARQEARVRAAAEPRGAQPGPGRPPRRSTSSTTPGLRPWPSWPSTPTRWNTWPPTSSRCSRGRCSVARTWPSSGRSLSRA